LSDVGIVGKGLRIFGANGATGIIGSFGTAETDGATRRRVRRNGATLAENCERRFMSLKVYINGSLVDREDAKVSVFDHGFLFGDGIFEGLRCYNGKIFRLKQHIDRLWDSAKTLDIQIPITKEEMSAAMYQTLEANGFTVLEVEGHLGTDKETSDRICFLAQKR
jgi:hypothetical protein